MFSSLASGMFIVYRSKNSQAPSERHVRMRDHFCEVLAIHAFTCPTTITWRAYGAARTRNSEILRASSFSNGAATSITEMDLRVSFSIDVMATFEIPHGVI